MTAVASHSRVADVTNDPAFNRAKGRFGAEENLPRHVTNEVAFEFARFVHLGRLEAGLETPSGTLVDRFRACFETEGGSIERSWAGESSVNQSERLEAAYRRTFVTALPYPWSRSVNKEVLLRSEPGGS